MGEIQRAFQLGIKAITSFVGNTGTISGKNGMEAVVRPIGRIIFSCVLSGLYQGFLRVHRKTMRSLFVHGDICD